MLLYHQLNKKMEQAKRIANQKAREVESNIFGEPIGPVETVGEEVKPLQNLPNGDIRCDVCMCNMNSEPQAQTHVNGE